MSDTGHEHDIVELLAKDHAELATQLSRFDDEPSSRWPELFAALTRELVRHEVAEEEVVYPAVRKDAPGGEQIAAARVEEQGQDARADPPAPARTRSPAGQPAPRPRRRPARPAP